MFKLEDIIVKPLLTEKVSLATEKMNRYGFVVDIRSNKNQIKMAIEKLFDVKVLNVKTSIAHGKTKRFRKGVKNYSKIKKAFIQVKEGQKIEFFRGI